MDDFKSFPTSIIVAEQFAEPSTNSCNQSVQDVESFLEIIPLELLENEIFRLLDLPSTLSLSWTSKRFLVRLEVFRLTTSASSKNMIKYNLPDPPRIASYIEKIVEDPLKNSIVRLLVECLRLNYTSLFEFFASNFILDLCNLSEDAYYYLLGESLALTASRYCMDRLLSITARKFEWFEYRLLLRDAARSRCIPLLKEFLSYDSLDYTSFEDVLDGIGWNGDDTMLDWFVEEYHLSDYGHHNISTAFITTARKRGHKDFFTS